nr:hypothetical chloroplast RF34 [Sparganium glomeratum]
MPRSRINENFIDKMVRRQRQEKKKAFTYYRDGAIMLTQSEGNYVQALQNYYEAMRQEIDLYDQSYILYSIGSYILYSIGLRHTSNGEHTKALEYYFRGLERNPFLPQDFNNMAVICHCWGEQAILQGDSEIAEAWFDQAAENWKQAIALTPGNYIEAHNWLKIPKPFEFE